MHMKRSGRAFRHVAAAALVLAAGSGCVTMKPMALSKEAPAPSLDPQQSLALATLRLANVYKTGYQPHARSFTVKSQGEKGESFTFDLGKPFKASEAETDQFEEFLVSMALPPGAYAVTTAHATASGFLIMGNGLVEINSPFNLEPARAVYLGRIDATRRERTGDEPRAGIVIPLIDQSVSGFSGGTFDVRIVDRYQEDVAIMRTQFPALEKVTVEKQILPPPQREPLAAPAAAPPPSPQ